MKALHVVLRLGLLIGLGIEILEMPSAAQTTPTTQAQPPAQGLQKLSGADDKRAGELDKAIDAAMKVDRWDETIARAEELLALRTRVQGSKHFEAVNAEWRLKTLRRVAGMPQLDRVAYRSAQPLDTEAESLLTLGKYTEAATLFEKSREIRTRLLTDLHPETATSVNNLGVVFYLQGKYKDAQRFSEKALDIFRLTLTEDHPDTAGAYSGIAISLNAQGKYAQAQPLFEKALEGHRRMLGDLNLNTAILYNNLGISLFSQGSSLRPNRSMRRRSRSAAIWSPTTTSISHKAAITWGCASYTRGSTRRLSHSSRSRSKFGVICSQKTTHTSRKATVTWP
jgi:tetratricopeptide (TPR) repeat protein